MKDFDIELFKKYYYQERLPLAEIARRFGSCIKAITNFITRKALEKRKTKTPLENLAGQKFNKLTFVSYIRNDKFGKALWLCRCECGREKVLNASAIKANLTTSCGCNKIKSLRKNGYELISWAFFKKLKKSSLSRDYEFDLTLEYLWELYKKQNGKCAITGVEITLFPDHNHTRSQTASPDRIDSLKGYIKGNVQWVHKRINRIKNILTIDELVFWANLIVKNHNHPIKKFDTNVLTWD